jgi:ketosteroid isomerase-like protein
MTVPTALELADLFFGAIVRGDVDTIRERVYAPGAVIWHNDDPHNPQDVEQNLRVLRWVSRNVRDLRYDEIVRQPTPDGFVQQHVLRGIAPDGSAIEVPACIICTVADGRVTFLAEYMDSAQIKALTGG